MQTDVLDIPLLIRMIEENPEWRALLRRVVLSDDLLELPELFRQLSAKVDALAEAQQRTDESVRALAEAQRRTDESLRALMEAQRRTDESLRALMEAQRRTDESVKALAEAQRRSEERLDRLEAAVQALAEAQRRSEERLDRLEAAVQVLAEAQRRTDERVDILSQKVDRLEEAQRRTEEKVDLLGQKVDHLSTEVTNLRRTVGATMEEEAEDWVAYLLEESGYQVLEKPVQVRMDGEIDVAIPAARDGQVIWAVVEAKTRLSRREIEDWANRMRSEGFRRRLAQYGVPGPYLAYIYGLRVDAACEVAARRFGIGLITGRGEQVPPGPLLPPAESDGGKEN